MPEVFASPATEEKTHTTKKSVYAEKANPAVPQPSPVAAKKPAKGSIILPDEKLIHRKPEHERSGLEFEAEAIESFNEKLAGEYNARLVEAKRRGINPNNIPKPKTYTVNDVLASKLKPNEKEGFQVGIVLVDAKKFYYKP